MSKKIVETKHFKLSQKIASNIQALPPGTPIPTVAELISKYRSSQATVTQALFRLKNQGLIEKPAGRKRLVVSAAKERFIAKITIIRPAWPSPEYDHILYTIQDEGIRQRYAFKIYVYYRLEDVDLNDALEGSDAAFLIPNTSYLTASTKLAFEKSPKPVVMLLQKPVDLKISLVATDDYLLGQMAVQSMIRKGRKSIAMLSCEPENISTTLRINGWRDEMQKNNLYADHLRIEMPTHYGQNSIQSCYFQLQNWARKYTAPPFDSIFTTSWTGALGLCKVLREKKWNIPHDVALISAGGENCYCEFLSPAITTLEVNMQQYAEEALLLIQRSLASTKLLCVHKLIKPSLIKRESDDLP